MSDRDPARGGWFFTASGLQVWPLDLRAEDIRIADIAQSLSRQNRFLGHTDRPYSVAQHSVIVSEAILDATQDRTLALWGLLHDASEAYLGDIISPIKHSGQLEGYCAAEARAMLVICQRFGLPAAEPELVKLHDKRALATERRDLVRAWANYQGPAKPGEDVPPYEAQIRAWPATVAQDEFLATFEDLGGR